MNARKSFDQLRELAKVKCDQDIAFARQTLKERIAQIDALERELDCIAPTVVQNKRIRRKHGQAKQQVISAIPDEPFTFDELMLNLNQSGENMPKSISYVRGIIRKMVKKGELNQVVNRESRQVKKYAWPHVDAEPAFPPLAKSILAILDAANAPMRPVEVCVQMIENGEPIENTDPTMAVNQILRVLREHPDKFREADKGYWKLGKEIT